MITIKSAPTKPETPSSRKELEFADAAPSRWPYAIGAAVAAILFYFKLGSGNANAPEVDADTVGSIPKPDIRPELVIAASNEEPEDSRRRNEDADDNDRDSAPLRRSAGAFSGSLIAEDEPIDFARLIPVGVRPGDDIQRPQSMQPVNDNMPPRDTSAAAGGGGGGGGGGDGDGDGGGGGGGSDGGEGGRDPRKPDPEQPDFGNPDPTEARNRGPRVQGALRLQDAVACHAFTIPLALLLTGADDPDGDALNVAGLRASAGTIARTTDGWTYTPAAEHLGPVVLTYDVTDGTDSVARTASFMVVRAPDIVGTDGNDILVGTECADTIQGGDGDDSIDGRGGSDLIYGGAGDDRIVVGSGVNIVHAGAGDDIVYGGAGRDIIFAGAGNDRVFAGDGDDVVFGEDGDDLVMAGAGSDHVAGGAGNDRLAGESGRDFLDGGDGNDTLEGGDNDDVIADGSGSDVAEGGDGDDVFLAACDEESDCFDGGAGFDSLSYASSTKDLVLDAESGTVTGKDGDPDSFAGIERLIGGQGDDHIIVGHVALVMQGGDGDDVFEFSDWDDDHDEDVNHDSDAESDLDTAGPAPGSTLQAQLVHEIEDLEPGDRILAKQYVLRGEDNSGSGNAEDTESDPFVQAYDDQVRDVRPFRFRTETRDEVDHSIIEVLDGNPVDGDDAGFIIFVIDVQGNYRFVYES